jgi:hypothetical protein
LSRAESSFEISELAHLGGPLNEPSSEILVQAQLARNLPKLELELDLIQHAISSQAEYLTSSARFGSGSGSSIKPRRTRARVQQKSRSSHYRLPRLHTTVSHHQRIKCRLAYQETPLNHHTTSLQTSIGGSIHATPPCCNEYYPRKQWCVL